MSINIEYDIDKPPFNKVENLKNIYIDYRYGYKDLSYKPSGSCISSLSFSFLSSQMTNQSSITDSYIYVVEMRDGEVYEFKEDEMIQLIGLLYKDINFKDAILMCKI